MSPPVQVNSDGSVYMRSWVGNLLCALMLLFVLSVAGFADTYTLAVYPSNDPQKLEVPMAVMADYLTEMVGSHFRLVITRDYAELLERLRNGTVDVAWINPVNYLRVREEMPSLSYIVTYLEHSPYTGEVQPYYHSYIVALKSSGIQTLEDLHRTRFAFVDPGSTSGYAYPAMLLRRNGVEPSLYFSKVFFLKRHDRVIESLVHGSVDGGAVSDGTFHQAIARHGDIFTIIARSEPIPLDALVAPPHLSDDLVQRVRAALTAMPVDHAFNASMLEHLGWSAAGFTRAPDGFYDSFRESMRQTP